MSHSIELARRAEKEVMGLDAGAFRRVGAAIDALCENPRPQGVRKLSGRENDWRIRIGNLRIIYSIDDLNRLVIIHRVTDRKDAYRGL